MKILLMLCAIFISQQVTLASHKHVVITTNEKTDGFGAQVQQIITNFVYADLHNLEFCYRPFKKMEHNYDNDPAYIIKKEFLLNFIGNFLTIDEAVKKGYHIISDNFIPFFDAHVYAVEAPLSKLKKIFRANKNIENYFNNENLNIAVHIRRPNPHDSWIYGTDVPNDIYVNVINKLRTKYSSQNPLFHVYSQGDSNNFSMYEAPDVIFHLNESVEDTYQGMVFADVLVTGKSSISYTAGYLSDGIVYYTPYAHAPLPHWIAIESILAEQ